MVLIEPRRVRVIPATCPDEALAKLEGGNPELTMEYTEVAEQGETPAAS